MKKITEEEEDVWHEWLEKKIKERDDCYKRENMTEFLYDEVAKNRFIQEMTKYYWCPGLADGPVSPPPNCNPDRYIEEFKKSRMEDAKREEKRFIARLSEIRPLPFNKFSSFEEEFEDSVEEMKKNNEQEKQLSPMSWDKDLRDISKCGGGGGAGWDGDSEVYFYDAPVYMAAPNNNDDIVDVDFISKKQKRIRKMIVGLVYDFCIFLAKVVFLTFVFLCLLRLLKNYLLQ